MLNQALISYALTFLRKRGFTPVQPPYFMTKSAMGKVGDWRKNKNNITLTNTTKQVSQLSDFDESLYHVGSISRGANNAEDKEEDARKEDDDKYLIATSEQPLCCLHMEEVLNVSDGKERGSMGEPTLVFLLG